MLFPVAVILVLLHVVASTAAEALGCPSEQDIAPHCLCNADEAGLSLDCFNVTSPDQISSIFDTNPRLTDIHHVFLHDFYLEKLPENIFGQTRIEEIYIRCSNGNMKSIHRDSFSNSKNFLKKLTIEYCSLERLDLIFLEAFTAIEVVELRNNEITNINMPYLPSLQKLYLLEPSLEQLYPFSNTPNLVHLATESEVLDQQDFQGIESCSKMTRLDIYYADLSEIPQGFMKLELLEVLYVSGSSEMTLREGSVKFASKNLQVFAVERTDLHIEEGAIVPVNLANTHFVLTYANLTTFDEGVFRELLESTVPGSGYLYLGGQHDFECGCDMAWLIVRNRHLLSKIVGSTGKRCTDGRSFDELYPDNFASC